MCVHACQVHACQVHAYYGPVTIATHDSASVASLLVPCDDRSSDVVQKYAVLIEQQRPLYGAITDMATFCSTAERAGSSTTCILPRQLDQSRSRQMQYVT